MAKYYKLNKNGYVLNNGSPKKIQKKWIGAIDVVKDACLTRYGKKVSAIYVVGSVASGTAVDYKSDLDMDIVLNIPKDKLYKRYRENSKWLNKLNHKIKKQFPFITYADSTLLSLDDIFKNKPFVGNTIKVESVCIYGKDISSKIANLKPGPGMQVSLHILPRYLKTTRMRFLHLKDKEMIKKHCHWMTRVLLRAGFDLVMPKLKKFTKDPLMSYRAFAKYYPDKAKEMKEVLNLSLKPKANAKLMIKVIDGIGKWLILKSQL